MEITFGQLFVLGKGQMGYRFTEERIRYPGFYDRDQSSITADFVRYTFTTWMEARYLVTSRRGTQCTSQKKTNLCNLLLPQKAHECEYKLQNHTHYVAGSATALLTDYQRL